MNGIVGCDKSNLASNDVADIDLPIVFVKPAAHRLQDGSPGFLKLFLYGCLYVCVCLCVSAPRLLITSSVMWHDVDPM